MLVGVITKKEEIEETAKFADVLEFRLDLCPELQGTEAPLPVIYTLRRKDQGGAFEGSEEARLQKIEELLKEKPAYLDLEFDVPESFGKKVRELSPKTQIIISNHDFEKTPENIESILEKMQKPFLAIYKLAMKANSSCDLLRAMQFLKKHAEKMQIAMISMGEFGEPSRVMGKVLGNALDYASLEGMPGLQQITLSELYEIYHYERLHTKTLFYGLIGDPVTKSPGHIFHNKYFKEHKIDGLYMKFTVQKKDLEEFLSLASTLPFRGLSVTMPLKQDVIPHLDEIAEDAQKIGAVNTLRFEKGLYGANTDAPGALDAIENMGSIRGKTVVMLGAGGAARAIAYETVKRGGRLIIVNRTLQKAKDLAAAFGGEAFALDEMDGVLEKGYDIFINTTSIEDKLPMKEENLAGTIFDIDHNPDTALLVMARKRNCKIVQGSELFVNQAILQHRIWD